MDREPLSWERIETLRARVAKLEAERDAKPLTDQDYRSGTISRMVDDLIGRPHRRPLRYRTPSKASDRKLPDLDPAVITTGAIFGVVGELRRNTPVTPDGHPIRSPLFGRRGIVVGRYAPDAGRVHVLALCRPCLYEAGQGKRTYTITRGKAGIITGIVTTCKQCRHAALDLRIKRAIKHAAERQRAGVASQIQPKRRNSRRRRAYQRAIASQRAADAVNLPAGMAAMQSLDRLAASGAVHRTRTAEDNE